MACEIAFKENAIPYNNMQFSSMMDFVIEIGEKMAFDDDVSSVLRMKKMFEEEFWPGRGIQIEDDFKNIKEQKFWARIFYETAREIFERKIGNQEYLFWQSQMIYQAYGTATLFTMAVRENEPKWSPDIRDHREFEEIVNKQKS